MSGKKTGLDKTTLGSRSTPSDSHESAATPALTIVYHPCIERIGERAVLSDLGQGIAAVLSRTEPLFAAPGKTGGDPLADEHVSRRPLHLIATGEGGVRIDVGDSGTKLFVRGERVRASVFFSASQVRRGVVLELSHRVVVLLHSVGSLHDVLGTEDSAGAIAEMTGESDALRRVLWELRSVAGLELPVLLRGETGTGKELVARAIHASSPRRQRPFVAVNLGAIAPALAVAELFGAERGAYTGSVRRQMGYFERARGGTLFLDEVGEAPVELQVALLRVLETGETQPVGAQQIGRADVRIIAATDADLEAKVLAGTFRPALLGRLATYEIWIPPLRERRDDIGRLLVRFLREELGRVSASHRLRPPAHDEKPWLPASLVARLADYDWPANVRQLRNVVRQLVIGNRGRGRVEVTPLVELLLRDEVFPAANPVPNDPRCPAEPRPASRPGHAEPRKPATVTEAELDAVLRACRWDLSEAAGRLGISRASIYLLIRRFPRFHTAGDLAAERIIQSYRDHNGDLSRMAEALEVSERALGRRVHELGLKALKASDRQGVSAGRARRRGRRG